MALDALVKTCSKNVAGNSNKVFFGHVIDVTTIALTNNEISTLTSTAKFQVYQAEIDSVKFEIKGTAGQNFFSTQTLTMKFAKMSAALKVALNALADAIPCGVLAIHSDGNGVGWLTGYDTAALDPISRPYNKMEITFDSGSKPSDAEAGAVTVVLTRESEHLPTPFDTNLSTDILDGTGTGFLAYS